MKNILGWDDFNLNEDLNMIKKLRSKELPLTIYRLITVETGKEVNKDNLGKHWSYKNIVDTDVHRSSIAQPKDDEYDTYDRYVVTAITDHDNVMWGRSEVQNEFYPEECEIFIKDPLKLKDIHINKLK